jgi:hypothetical protein
MGEYKKINLSSHRVLRRGMDFPAGAAEPQVLELHNLSQHCVWLPNIATLKLEVIRLHAKSEVAIAYRSIRQTGKCAPSCVMS